MHNVTWSYDSLGRQTSNGTGLGIFSNYYVGDTGTPNYVLYPNGQRTFYDFLPNNQGKFVSSHRFRESARFAG